MTRGDDGGEWVFGSYICSDAEDNPICPLCPIELTEIHSYQKHRMQEAVPKRQFGYGFLHSHALL